MPEVQIKTVGRWLRWATPKAKKAAERSSKTGIAFIVADSAKATAKGADRDPGQMMAIATPKRLSVSAMMEAQIRFVVLKSIDMEQCSRLTGDSPILGLSCILTIQHRGMRGIHPVVLKTTP